MTQCSILVQMVAYKIEDVNSVLDVNQTVIEDKEHITIPAY